MNEHRGFIRHQAEAAYRRDFFMRMLKHCRHSLYLQVRDCEVSLEHAFGSLGIPKAELQRRIARNLQQGGYERFLKSLLIEGMNGGRVQ